jgi:hypothetical protein
MSKFCKVRENIDTTQHSMLNHLSHRKHTPYRFCKITGLDALYCDHLPSQNSNYNDEPSTIPNRKRRIHFELFMVLMECICYLYD